MRPTTTHRPPARLTGAREHALNSPTDIAKIFTMASATARRRSTGVRSDSRPASLDSSIAATTARVFIRVQMGSLARQSPELIRPGSALTRSSGLGLLEGLVHGGSIHAIWMMRVISPAGLYQLGRRSSEISAVLRGSRFRVLMVACQWEEETVLMDEVNEVEMLDELGPVDWIVVEFPGSRFRGGDRTRAE